MKIIKIDAKKKGKSIEKKNADKIKEKKQQTFVCECGCSLTIEAKYRHIKTKKHLDLIEAKNSQQTQKKKPFKIKISYYII